MTDVTLRRATVDDAEALAAVRVDSWRRTYRGIIPEAVLDSMETGQSAAMWRQVLAAGSEAVAVYVAEDAGEVLGFAAGMTLAESKFGLDAELTGLYLEPEIQRSGVGRRLLALVANALQQQGATGMVAWVIADNQAAREFFERLGAELLIEQAFSWDGLDLMEAGYGWRSLSTFRQPIFIDPLRREA